MYVHRKFGRMNIILKKGTPTASASVDYLSQNNRRWGLFTPPDNHHIFFNVYINLEPLSYENRLLGCKNTNLFAYKGIFWGFSSKKSHNLTVIQRC